MLTRERQSRIRSRLDTEGSVVAAELAVEFDVSEDTIRRDLRELAAEGHCERVYGGALLRRSVVPIGERLTENREVKAALAREAAGLLPDGGFVFIDAGSTNMALAEAIGPGRSLTVMTNAPAIAATLSLRPEITVILTGGTVEPTLGAAVDAAAVASLEGILPDLFVLGVCAIDPQGGLYAERRDDHLFKRAVASRSRRLLTLADRTKFTAATPYGIAGFSADLTLVTEAGLPEERLASIRAAGASIVLARDTRP